MSEHSAEKDAVYLYEVVSLYDSRIIRRDLTYADADALRRDINRRTDYGAKVQKQRYPTRIFPPGEGRDS